MSLTLGSLFDGIGGFPLAGVRNGITPVWASEIEAFPIEVTKLRFPEMLHFGDITKLNGADLPPVDIITGGSPCQDLSVAGARAGLNGERSGLFMEQIRIIKEMRDAAGRRSRADDAVRPRYMVWENVPGAFSSAECEDFRVVIEETARIVDGSVSIPRPPSGVWKSSGAVLGGKFSIAWRVLDAQYWPGTPQRRRRIFLVADFAGHSAGKILFEQDSLFGNTAPRESPWQGASLSAPASAGDTGGDEARRKLVIPVNTQIATRHMRLGEGTGFGNGENGDPALTIQEAHSHDVFLGTNECLTPWDTQQARIFTEDAIAPTIAGADGGGGRNPAGLLFEKDCLTPWDALSRRIHDKKGVWPALYGGEGGGHGYVAAFCAGAAPTAGGIGYQEETSPTLKAGESGTNMVPSVLCLMDQGGQRMDLTQDVTGTLRSRMDGHPPLVMATQQGGAEIGEGICPTITSAAGTSGNNQPVLLYENHGIDSRYTGSHDVAPTMSARYGTGGNNTPLVEQENSYCIAGNIIERETKNGGNGFGLQANISYTLNCADRHAVYAQQRSDEYAESPVVCTQAARQYKDATDLVCEVAGIDCRNGSENGDLCGTLQAKTTGGYSLNNTHPVRTGNLIRRLTPLECERLQGFPDGWTDIPSASDSKRYKACGNSVAIPCVEYVLRGIAHFLSKMRGGKL